MLCKLDHHTQFKRDGMDWLGLCLMLGAGGRLGGNAVSSRCWAGSPDLVRMT